MSSCLRLLIEMNVHLLRVDQQVFRLDVSMDHVVAMAVFDSFKQLVYVSANLIKLDPVRILLEDFEQVFVQILEDEVETIASVQVK